MMDEWIVRIVAQDLNKDAEVFDGLYITFGSTELFESVNSLINVARGTADTKVQLFTFFVIHKFVFGTMEVASVALTTYQNTISAVLQGKVSCCLTY